MVKPTFLVVGSMKCGTTSLVRALQRHPKIGKGPRKETHFFDRKYRRGLQWYEDLFSLAPGEIHVGEKTPVYMYDPQVRRRIAEDLPGVRLVAIVRDPVARAYSHYWHSLRNRKETLTFEEALAAEPERLATAEPPWTYRWSYVDRGRYADQLQDFAELVGREALFVTTLEAAKADPSEPVIGSLKHLGLDPAEQTDLTMPRRNRGRRGKRLPAGAVGKPQADPQESIPPMSAELRERLMVEFAAEDAKLKQWMGWERLPWDSLADK